MKHLIVDQVTHSSVKSKAAARGISINEYVKYLVDNDTSSGISKSKAYVSWVNMKSRCDNPKHKQYKDYGGRGITYDSSFNDFQVYEEFITSLPGYGTQELSIDRIDNSRGYFRDNMKLSTRVEQNTNQRVKKNNTSGYSGVTLKKDCNKWQADIRYDNKRKYLGLFNTPEEAARRRNDFIIQEGLPHKLAIIDAEIEEC